MAAGSAALAERDMEPRAGFSRETHKAAWSVTPRVHVTDALPKRATRSLSSIVTVISGTPAPSAASKFGSLLLWEKEKVAEEVMSIKDDQIKMMRRAGELDTQARAWTEDQDKLEVQAKKMLHLGRLKIKGHQKFCGQCKCLHLLCCDFCCLLRAVHDWDRAPEPGVTVTPFAAPAADTHPLHAWFQSALGGSAASLASGSGSVSCSPACSARGLSDIACNGPYHRRALQRQRGPRA